jgi:peroxiredoxin
MNENDRIQSFELPDQDGVMVSSDALLGQGPLVVYFYIKAKTSG